MMTDGIVGEVLFYVLHFVLGPSVYTREVHIAWVKVYNRMIRTIIPVAVSLELRTGPSEMHQEREYEDCIFPHLQPQIRPSSQDFGTSHQHPCDSCSTKEEEDEGEPLESEKIRREAIHGNGNNGNSMQFPPLTTTTASTSNCYRCTWSTDSSSLPQ